MWLIGAYFVWIICMWLCCPLSFFEKSFAIIYCILCLCDLLQTLTFPIIYEHSLSRSFLIATLYYEVGHPTQNICECNAKSYSRRCILSKKKQFVFLLWFSFRRSFFVCFLSNVLMYTCFHSNWFHIETWKWCIEKDKTPEGVYLLKVTNKDTGIIKSCS